jgi:hypothetical protein
MGGGGGETYVLVHRTGHSNVVSHSFGIRFANRISELVPAILGHPDYPSNNIGQGLIL